MKQPNVFDFFSDWIKTPLTTLLSILRDDETLRMEAEQRQRDRPPGPRLGRVSRKRGGEVRLEPPEVL